MGHPQPFCMNLCPPTPTRIPNSSLSHSHSIDALLTSARARQLTTIRAFTTGPSALWRGALYYHLGQLAYNTPFAPSIRDSCRRTIQNQVLTNTKILLEGYAMGLRCLRVAASEEAKLVEGCVQEEGGEVEVEVLGALRWIWGNEGFRDGAREWVWKGGLRDWRDGSSYLYLSSWERILDPGYVPTDMDILQTPPIATRTEINGTQSFRLGELEYQITDIYHCWDSGWTKWRHYFDDTHMTAIIFVADISVYDLDMGEKHMHSCLEPALQQFDMVINGRYQQNLPVLLLLSGYARFIEKIELRPLHLDEYDPRADLSRHAYVVDKILDRFISLNLNAERREIYTHFWYNVEDDPTRFILSAFEDIIARKNENNLNE